MTTETLRNGMNVSLFTLPIPIGMQCEVWLTLYLDLQNAVMQFDFSLNPDPFRSLRPTSNVPLEHREVPKARYLVV